MVMLGGAGVVTGAIAGAFVLGFAEAFGYAFIPGSMTLTWMPSSPSS